MTSLDDLNPILDSYPLIKPEEADEPLSKEVHNHGIHYSKFKIFAHGGKCVIYSCRDLHLNRTVAYKKLKPDFAKDPGEQTRFLREARVSAALQHPNTLPVYEISRENSGQYYFTMKLVHGPTLNKIISKVKEGDPSYVEKYTLDTFLGMLVQICNCMNYAHTHGVIHRDVKPENILTGTFGEVLLIDWGQARVGRLPDPEISQEIQYPIFDSNTMTLGGQFQGTPLYMSPEQIKNRNDVDHRSDIYCLGVLLYEILTKENVVTGDTFPEVMSQTTRNEIITPRERVPNEEIPEELENICMKCLQLDPNARYSTVEELLADIREFRLRKMKA